MAADIDPARLDLARVMGADLTINTQTEDLTEVHDHPQYIVIVLTIRCAIAHYSITRICNFLFNKGVQKCFLLYIMFDITLDRTEIAVVSQW